MAKRAKPLASAKPRRPIRKKNPFVPVKHEDDIRKPIIKPPRLIKSPPKYNVTQLMRTVSKARRELVKDLAIKKLGTVNLPVRNKLIPPETPTYRIQTYSKHNKHIHQVHVFCVDQNPFNEHSHVLVDCSCADHTYRYEFNLAKTGNSFLWRCNGEPPTVYTKLSICKHTYIALRYMLRQSEHGVLVRKSKVRPRVNFSKGA